MLLRRYGKNLDIQHRLAIGQCSLLLGIGGTLFSRFWTDSFPPFIQGLCFGFSAVLIGISLVFNLSTLPRVIERFKLDQK